MEELSETFNKEIENILKEPIRVEEYNNQNKTHTLEGIDSRLNDAEKFISDLDERVMKSTQDEQQKEKIIFKNENRLKGLLEKIKRTNIHIIGVLKEEEREWCRKII